MLSSGQGEVRPLEAAGGTEECPGGFLWDPLALGQAVTLGHPAHEIW